MLPKDGEAQSHGVRTGQVTIRGHSVVATGSSRAKRSTSGRLTGTLASGTLRSMRRLRTLALMLAFSLPFVSGASVFAGAIALAAAGHAGHRVSLRLCEGASFDVVLAHDGESEQAGATDLGRAASEPSRAVVSCGAWDGADWDHVLRCAATEGGAAPTRALDAPPAPVAAVPSVELGAVHCSTASAPRTSSTYVPAAAVQRSVVLRI